MEFRSGVDETENELVSVESAIEFDPEEDRAVQADAKEANINEIVRRFRSSGVPPRLGSTPVFGDFTEQFDLATAFQVQRDASEAFMALGAEVRRRFNDDPLALAAFLADDRNRTEAEALGLVRKAPVSDSGAIAAPSGEAAAGEGA